MRIILSSFVAFALCAFPSFGDEQTFIEVAKVPGKNQFQRSKKLKNTSERQVKKGFAAQLIITTDKTVFKRWIQPSATFSFKSSSQILKGEVFYPLFVYWNAQKDNHNRVKVTYQIEILKPDGTVYVKENLEAGEGELNEHGAILVKNYLAVTIEEKDPLGIYKVNIYLKDEVSLTGLVLTSSFEVIKNKQKSEKPPTDKELNEFLTYFYKGDKVELFSKMLKYSDEIPGWYDRSEVWMYFYSEVFRKYSHHLSAWMPVFNQLSLPGKYLVWDSLWQAHTASSLAILSEIKNKADTKGQKYISQLLKSKYSALVEKKISSPSDLDNNWAAFMASGNGAFVQNVINQVKPIKGKSGLKLQIIISARWSLISNCQQHPQILGLVEAAYVAENDEEIKKVLEEIILEGRKPLVR